MKFILPLIALLFLGCQNFEPPKNKQINVITINKYLKNKNGYEKEILYFNKDIITLNDFSTIPYNKHLNKNFIALSKNISINATKLRINNKTISFDKMIATASNKNNLIAIIFADNSFTLYDLNKNKSIFDTNFGDSLVNRKFIAKPIFYKDLLLLPTLNGKLVIYDLQNNQIVRSIIVSNKDYFNNIIYLNVINDNLIIASRDTIMVIGVGVDYVKHYNIKHILTDTNFIYIFTIQGDIKKLNFALKEIKSTNLKYSNPIAPMIYKDNIYFLVNSNNAYLVKMNKNLNNYSLFKLTLKNKDECFNEPYLKQYIFSNDGTYYIGTDYFKVK